MKHLRHLVSAVVLTIGASAAQASLYSSVYVFGDSLSDGGNVAALLGPAFVTPVPVPGNTFIPSAPYASGTFTNAQTWTTQFGAALGLSITPSFLGGTNYAIGGATTSGGFGSLSVQVAGYLGGFSGLAPSDALYVIAGGGNNARNALVQATTPGADFFGTIAAAAAAYAFDTVQMILALEARGVDDIVVWNTPNVGLAPAIALGGPGPSFFGSLTATAMNTALAIALAALPPQIASDVRVFDLYGMVTSAVQNPAAFGFDNVTLACAANPVTCTDPNRWLFWDGIHPTSGGQALIAQNMLRLVGVPLPATLPLLAIGLVGVWGLRRRRA